MRKWTIVYENRLEIYMKSRERVLKAMRTVKTNGVTVVGMFASEKNLASIQFESSLEADFIRMLEFDLNVDRFVEQPVRIKYKDSQGKARIYTPDFLAYFHDRDDGKPYHVPILYEVKYRSHIKKDWKTLKPKLLAAMRYCDEMGWKFQIKTEIEIKTQYTENIKFIIPYTRQTPDYSTIETIMLALNTLKKSTPEEVISYYSKDYLRQAELVPALWFLIGSKRIGCDLTEKLTMTSKIWILQTDI